MRDAFRQSFGSAFGACRCGMGALALTSGNPNGPHFSPGGYGRRSRPGSYFGDGGSKTAEFMASSTGTTYTAAGTGTGTSPGPGGFFQTLTQTVGQVMNLAASIPKPGNASASPGNPGAGVATVDGLANVRARIAAEQAAAAAAAADSGMPSWVLPVAAIASIVVIGGGGVYLATQGPRRNPRRRSH